ncbi:MAG TPA: hypothetical protein VNV88_08020, partial [Candidatus Solibacter sp.]|nr:hypothetical protein [Candidatus Solibacter sp.]
MRKLTLIALVGVFLLTGRTVHAQQLDAAFGLSAVHSTSAFDASGSFFPQSVGGGVFPTFSADFLLYKHFGVGGEVSWRATRNFSGGFAPFRPIFYDFDAVYAPPLGKRAALELVAGLGGESIRFYQDFFTCGAFSCSNFVSSNHLLGAVGAGIKLYTVHDIFIRPEARFYFIRHN